MADDAPAANERPTNAWVAYQRNKRADATPALNAHAGPRRNADQFRVGRALYKFRGQTAWERLGALSWIEPHIRAVLAATAIEAHHAGASWAEVGEVLGISRQAAQQRFGPVRGLRRAKRIGFEEDGASESPTETTPPQAVETPGRPEGPTS